MIIPRIISGLLTPSDYPVFLRSSLKNKQHTAHFMALEFIDELACSLSSQFREGGYNGVNLESLLSGKRQILFGLIGVEKEAFLSLFYECVGKLYPELSYFGGSVTEKWLESARIQYKNGKIFKFPIVGRGKNTVYTLILDDKDIPFALYKPRESLLKKADQQRKVDSELLSSLIAKEMNFDDVVNRVIPVKCDKELAFSPCHYTGTIERFLGLSKDQIVGKKNVVDLVGHVLKFSTKEIRLENNKVYEVPDLDGFKRMFGEEYERAEVETFADKNILRPIDLYKIIVFWYSSGFLDGHGGKIIAYVNPDQTLKLTFIDCEFTWKDWDKTDNVRKISPIVYQLDQAKRPLLPTEMLPVLNKCDEIRFKNIFKAFDLSLREKEASFFARFHRLKQLSNQTQTLRSLMHSIAADSDKSIDKNLYIKLCDGIKWPVNHFPDITEWIFSYFGDKSELDKFVEIKRPRTRAERLTKKLMYLESNTRVSFGEVYT